MKITIPFPDNPEHVANLASIPLLEAQGFEGLDACLRESLFEYGMVWRLVSPTELVIVYRHTTIPGSYDRVTIDPTAFDVYREYNWIKSDDWSKLFSTHGTTKEEFDALPLTAQIESLVNYFGVENIFGTSYWVGFSVFENSPPEVPIVSPCCEEKIKRIGVARMHGKADATSFYVSVETTKWQCQACGQHFYL